MLNNVLAFFPPLLFFPDNYTLKHQLLIQGNWTFEFFLISSNFQIVLATAVADQALLLPLVEAASVFSCREVQGTLRGHQHCGCPNAWRWELKHLRLPESQFIHRRMYTEDLLGDRCHPRCTRHRSDPNKQGFYPRTVYNLTQKSTNCL